MDAVLDAMDCMILLVTNNFILKEIFPNIQPQPSLLQFEVNQKDEKIWESFPASPPSTFTIRP